MSVANSVFSDNVVPLPTASERLVVFELSYDWRNIVHDRLTELVRLPHGWDGYRGEPVSLENALFAVKVLEAVCGPEADPPHIVPGVAGDLQIEWHNLKGDIELHVLAPNRVNAWHAEANGDVLGEARGLTIDFRIVADWVKKITEPDVAIGSAAA
jgi:hypothetical protein